MREQDLTFDRWGAPVASHFSSSQGSGGGSPSHASVSQFDTSAFEEDPEHGHAGRIVAVAAVTVVVALVAVVGVCGYSLYSSAKRVKDEASAIMASASDLVDDLKSGDATELDASVGAICDSVDLIYDEVNGTLWDLAAKLPVVGTDVQSVQTLAEVAKTLVYDVLVPIADDVSGVGLSDLFQDGAINVGLISTLATTVDEVMPVLEDAIDTILALPEPTIEQLASVLDQVQEPLEEVDELLAYVEPILDVLPQMLGADGQTRTYLVIAQNNSELRATGGLPGSWGTITITDGVIEMGEFVSILHEDGLEVEVSDEEVLALGIDTGADPAQVNCIADFPTVAERAQDYWEQAGYGTVDGVVALDPVFLGWLLDLTGGFTMSDGTEVTGDSIAELLLSEIYWMFGDDGDAQDAYYVEVAGLAFSSIMGNLGGVDMTALLETFVEGFEDGRFLAWMADADEQALMEELGCTGEVTRDVTTPVLGVYLNDDTYAKINWYTSVQTTIGEATVNEDGTTTYLVTTTVTNTITEEIAAEAPTYVVGTNYLKRSTDDMVAFLHLYAPYGGTITYVNVSDGGLVDGFGISDYMMDDIQVITMRMHCAAGETVTITYLVEVSAEATEELTVRTTPLAQESLM